MYRKLIFEKPKSRIRCKFTVNRELGSKCNLEGIHGFKYTHTKSIIYFLHIFPELIPVTPNFSNLIPRGCIGYFDIEYVTVLMQLTYYSVRAIKFYTIRIPKYILRIVFRTKLSLTCIYYTCDLTVTLKSNIMIVNAGWPVPEIWKRFSTRKEWMQKWRLSCKKITI